MALGSDHGSYIMRVSNQPCYFRAIFTIENFLRYPAKVGSFIRSPPFQSTSGDNVGLKWYLKVYPRGQTDDVKDSVGLFALCDELPNHIVNVSLSFYAHILSETGNRVYCVPERQSSDVKKHRLYGWDQFIRRQELEKGSAEFLPDGHLTLECDIEAYIEFRNPKSTAKVQKGSMEIAGLNFQGSTLKTIYREKICSDVVLKSADGRLFDAHKCVLAAGSPFFAAMFRHPMKENERNMVDLAEDMNGEELEALLEYLYLGTPPSNLRETARKMFQIADMQGIVGLRALGEEVLIGQLNDSNAVELLNFGAQYGAVELKKAAALRIAESDK